MKPDDPKLTAYALGELEGTEAETIAATVKADPTLQREVAAIQKLAGELQQEYDSEAKPGLRPEQVTRLQQGGHRQISWRMVVVGVVSLAAAVILLLSLITPYLMDSRKPADGEMAENEIAKPNPVTSKNEPVENARGDLLKDVPMEDFKGSPYDKDQFNDVIGIGGGIRDKRSSRPGYIAFCLDDTTAWELDQPGISTETYDPLQANPFRRTAEPGGDASTFSIDVDTAAYANLRRILTVNGILPPKGAVRIEEMINYFSYDYTPPPTPGDKPFAVHTEVGTCPWQPDHRLVRIGIKGRVIKTDNRPASNLVFLIDSSGSMRTPRKLPLLQAGFKMLTKALDERDRIAIVTYAGSSGLALPSVTGDKREEIIGALNRLRAGGSTNGGAGIELAYKTARKNLIAGGNNRVILATDGDFNVGISDRSRLMDLIKKEAAQGVELTILGFGTGNYKDAMMEELSNQGNGNYYYIDNQQEARKVLVEDLTGTMITIAKDVKIQVFFNPTKVAAWRLIGYENRRLARQDFNDDTKDAGEIGAGHCVTALYQVVPQGGKVPGAKSDPNPFVKQPEPTTEAKLGNTFMRLRLRHKPPEGTQSLLQEFDIQDRDNPHHNNTLDYRWASSVAAFGLLLREDGNRGNLTWAATEEMAASAMGPDRKGYRAECLQLIRKARQLAQTGKTPK